MRLIHSVSSFCTITCIAEDVKGFIMKSLQAPEQADAAKELQSGVAAAPRRASAFVALPRAPVSGGALQAGILRRTGIHGTAGWGVRMTTFSIIFPGFSALRSYADHDTNWRRQPATSEPMNPGLQPSEWPPLSGAKVGDLNISCLRAGAQDWWCYVHQQKGVVHVSRPGFGQAAEDSLRRTAAPWLTVHFQSCLRQVCVGERVLYLSKKHGGWMLGMVSEIWGRS